MVAYPAVSNSAESSVSFRVVHHPRARRVTLRVEHDGELVLTAPRHVSRAELERLVSARQGWIESTRQRLAQARSLGDPETSGLRPSRIELPAIAEQWRVEYLAGSRTGIIPADRLIRLPETESAMAVAQHLQTWLKQRARQTLVPRVDELATRFGMRFEQVSIRNQRSRWGSCSATGRLSLNARLLFCTPQACDYVLIHELVHVEHPNHSPHFWRRVEQLCPHYRDSMASLKTVWQQLPDWVRARRRQVAGS